MKITKARLKEIIKEELLKEGMYGEEDSFIPLRVDKYAPNTRIGLKNTIESLEGAAFGFTLSEDSEMDYPSAADAAHEAYNKWAKGMGTKLQKLYKAIKPLLANLKQNPEKEYILWPNRVGVIEKFESHLADIVYK